MWQIMRHTGRFWLLTVLAVSLPSLGLLPLTRINVHSSEWLKWVSVTPVGMGMGAATTCGLIALIAHVNREDVAVSTASSYLFRYGGQVVGVASSGAVLQWNLDRELHRRITGDGAEEVCVCCCQTPIVHPSDCLMILYSSSRRSEGLVRWWPPCRQHFVLKRSKRTFERPVRISLTRSLIHLTLWIQLRDGFTCGFLGEPPCCLYGHNGFASDHGATFAWVQRGGGGIRRVQSTVKRCEKREKGKGY